MAKLVFRGNQGLLVMLVEEAAVALPMRPLPLLAAQEDFLRAVVGAVELRSPPELLLPEVLVVAVW